MKNKEEQSLVIINKNSIFYKIKKFFYNYLKKKDEKNIIEKNSNEQKNDSQNKQFKEYIKNIENEETKLLKLQKMYRSAKIKEEELTQIQIKYLCDLYDKQIENLRRTNEYRKKRIIELRKL